MKILFVILLSACAFVAAILNLAISSRYKARIMGVSACFAVITGLICYGYGYALADGLSAVTVLRTLLTVSRMFGGVNDFGAVSATPLFRYDIAVAIFWLAHFLAFYVTASAAIAVLGQRLLRHLRLRLLRLSGVTLVYGATPETVGLVKVRNGGRGLVLLSKKGDNLASLADAVGGVTLECDADAFDAPYVLKRIGFNPRQTLEIYCISADAVENHRFAAALRKALQAQGVEADRVSLFLLGVSETRAVALLAGPDRYGYGSLFACDRYELTARLALRLLPPWMCVRFDDRGRATSDLRVLIVGFGQMGWAMLKQLVMNGQFEGSHFSADVVDARMDALSGPIQTRFSAMLDAYDIRLAREDARSATFYKRLETLSPDLIVLCTGSCSNNAEIKRELERYYEPRKSRPPILQCDGDSVLLEDQRSRLGQIDVNLMDRMAMVLNHVYCGGPSPEADWRACDAFSRASCRASVDFLPAYRHIMGFDSLAALERAWPPDGELLENLARTEHKRWCAFHLAMGYRPMSREDFDRRAERFRTGEKLRIGKDTLAMTHACLVPWEALDELSARECAVTGKPLDYKQMDRDNILAIPEILRMASDNP